MRLIGLVGGLRWEPTAMYFRLINEHVQRVLGKEHSARILVSSMNFGGIDFNNGIDDWHEVSRIVAQAGHSLKSGGADFLVMTSNSLHRFSEQISTGSGLELLHIADPVGSEIQKNQLGKVALLACNYTLESECYSDLLSQRYGASVILPNAEDQLNVHRIINNELNHGVVRMESRRFVGDLIRKFHQDGAQALILACSELNMVVPPDCDFLPVYDSTRLHARAVAQHAMAGVDQ